ncbi:MAG: SPFH domain-containing protein [Vicingaceae bacterium]|jgi:regulator of protease activity HflC (stomatin/prohibitin superfamily)
MFGINYTKFDPMKYVIHYRNGKIINEGKGLSLFYFAQNSSIISIPLNSQDIPFAFKINTNDYQTVTVQGQITYYINEPLKINEQLDFTVNKYQQYVSDDYEKLTQRMINEAQTSISSFTQQESVTSILSKTGELEAELNNSLQDSLIINNLGIEIMSVSVLSIKADPEMQRALEAKTREALQKDADQAIYDRRNFAVEQERKIKESELNTEIAVEHKQKQIVEKKMETDLTKQDNESRLRKIEMESNLVLEELNEQLVKLKALNIKHEADARGYSLEAEMKAFKDVDWKVISALNQQEQDPKNTIALAFRELASNETKIGNLNISPDLISSLLSNEANV